MLLLLGIVVVGIALLQCANGEEKNDVRFARCTPEIRRSSLSVSVEFLIKISLAIYQR